VREFRKRQKLGLMARKVRINLGRRAHRALGFRARTVRKLIALGYLERGGDEKAEGMAARGGTPIVDRPPHPADQASGHTC
jgi:hypothetical protein